MVLTNYGIIVIAHKNTQILGTDIKCNNEKYPCSKQNHNLIKVKQQKVSSTFTDVYIFEKKKTKKNTPTSAQKLSNNVPEAEMTVSVGAEGQSHLYASYAEDMRFPCGHNTALLGIQAYGMPDKLL